jgi:3-phosphoshikimate 1-carboxyvinyltransferase
MAAALEAFGLPVDLTSEPWIVDGGGGRLSPPTDQLDAHESGLTARIAIAMASLVDGLTSIDGRGQLRRRPMRPLLEALAGQGVVASSDDGLLPVTIRGLGRLPGGEVAIDGSLSSQFASALLLVAPLASKETTLRIEGGRVSEGYMALTTEMMASYGVTVTPTITGFEVPNLGYKATDLEVEPDLSAAAYPMVAAAITSSRVRIEGVTRTSRQPDIAVASWLATMGCELTFDDGGLALEGPGSALKPIEADLGAAPDGALALAVACLFAEGTSRLSGLSTLRHKESDRLTAMVEGFERLGGQAATDGETLVIEPVSLHQGRIDPHGDHRVAMSLALVGLRVDDVLIGDPGVVDKTWPGYWDEMASLTGV